MRGVIRHGLPWTLSDVDIICISPFRSRLPSYTVLQGVSQETPMDALPNPGIYGRIAAWPTGEDRPRAVPRGVPQLRDQHRR